MNSYPPNRSVTSYRPFLWLKIALAIAVAWIASTVQAQPPGECCTGEAFSAPPPLVHQDLQYDGASAAESLPIVINDFGGARRTNRRVGEDRPAYVDVLASLANFDSDADPDGWRVDLVLRDRRDRPVVMRANATFELTPSVKTADHWGRYVDADQPATRWSVPLEFDDDAVARVKLPLRKSLRPAFGWPSSIYPPGTSPNIRYGHHVRGLNRRLPFVARDPRSLISYPAHGHLRVRVSVPTEGVFKAETIVRIRPSVLVDTQWPYR